MSLEDVLRLLTPEGMREVEAFGIHSVASRMGTTVTTCAKILAGIRVYRGTVMLVARGLRVEVELP